MSIKLSGFDLDREQQALIDLDIPDKEFYLRCEILSETNIYKHLEHCVYYVSGIFWNRLYDSYKHLTLDDEKVYKHQIQQKIIPYINKYYDSIRHKSHNDKINGFNKIYDFAQDKVLCPTVGKYLDFIIEQTFLFNEIEVIEDVYTSSQ
tara:strand:+ start:198 stop:644 length:447 start_codon:yes stop_codon:yes gene_type:complete